MKIHVLQIYQMIPALLKCATPYRQREDSSIFTAGGAFLPAKNRQSIRQRLFRVDVGLPPVPENQQVLKLA